MPSVAGASAAESTHSVRTAADRLFDDRFFLHLIGPPSLALAATSLASLVVPSLRPLLASFCHQIESRTVCLHGTPMGLCARCTGIYLGLAAAWVGMRWLADRPPILRLVEPAALLIAGLSVSFYLTGVEVDNAARLVLGLGFGASVGLVLWRARRWLLRRRADVMGVA